MESKDRWITYWSQPQRGLRLIPKNDLGRTIEVSLPINIEGNMIRIRFSNDYGLSSVYIEDVHIYYNDNVYKVTFNKSSCLKVSPSIEYISDRISLNLERNTQIKVRFYIKENQANRPVSGSVIHPSYGINLIRSDIGNYADFTHWEIDKTEDEFIDKENLVASDDKYKAILMLLSGMDIYTKDYKQTVVAFGDSITEQGVWTEPLRKSFENSSLINQGLGGNRLLKEIRNYASDINEDSEPVEKYLKSLNSFPLDIQIFGEAAIKRFERDVFKRNVNVSHVIVSLGINDLYQPGKNLALQEELPSFEDIIDGYLNLIEVARIYKSKIFFCTITPFNGAEGIIEEREELRKRINHWIRNNKYIDGFFDFSKQIESKEEFTKIQEIYDSGDHLHPNSLGGMKMFECIDLNAFK